MRIPAGDDLGPEWEAGHRDELEVRPRHWQSDDGDRLHDCGSDVPHGKPHPRNNEPDDVGQHPHSSSSSRDHFPAERPDDVAGNAE